MNTIITGATKLAGLLGHPVGHSISPAMHNFAFSKLGINCVYLCFEVWDENLEEAVKAMRTLDVLGFNVTMPNKKNIMKYLDEISEEARLIDAVNTVKLQNNRLIGYNTDGPGFVKGFDDNGVEYKNKKIVICGAGGAGRAISISLALAGARELAIFDIAEAASVNLCGIINQNIPNCLARPFSKDEAAMAREMSDASIFIQCTGIGMHPNADNSVITDPSAFFPELTVADVIYEPSPTKLLAQAAARGCKTIDGRDMVYNQGALAFKIWTGEEMPLEYVKARMRGE